MIGLLQSHQRLCPAFLQTQVDAYRNVAAAHCSMQRVSAGLELKDARRDGCATFKVILVGESGKLLLSFGHLHCRSRQDMSFPKVLPSLVLH